MDPETLLTAEQLAERLQISRSTLSRLRSQGLPYVSIGKLVRFSQTQINEWLQQNQGQSAQKEDHHDR